MTAQKIGWLSSILGIAMMITSYPAGHLADKRGTTAIAWVCSAISRLVLHR